jgi:hypothetical protein
MQTSSKLLREYIIALTVNVLWSSTGIIFSYLSKTYSLPSLVLACGRDLFVSFGLFMEMAFVKREVSMYKLEWACAWVLVWR